MPSCLTNNPKKQTYDPVFFIVLKLDFLACSTSKLYQPAQVIVIRKFALAIWVFELDQSVIIIVNVLINKAIRIRGV